MSVHELRAVDLEVRRGDRSVLHGIELSAAAGRWTTITGASGSGKTTLLQVLAGLLPARTGAVLVDGRPAWTGSHGQPVRGVVLQDHPFVSLLTAAETVSLPLQARHAPKEEIRRRTRDGLAALGLEATADQLVADLSGGQRQRVAIARILAMDAQLLFLDEPTAELDAANRHVVLSLLRERADAGAVVIIVTHDPAILDLSDTILTLTAAGRLTI